MATATGTSKRAGFLPEGGEIFLRHRLREVVGLAFAALGLFVATAVFFHSPNDRSWNIAVDRPVANPLGRAGAVVADILVQTLGWVSMLLPLVFLVWAGSALLHRPMRRPWLRVTALPVALLAAAIAAAMLPRMPIVQWAPGLAESSGGAVGRLALQSLAETAPAVAGYSGAVLAAAVAAAIAPVALAVSCGLSLSEWLAVVGHAGRAVLMGLHAVFTLGRVGRRLRVRAARVGKEAAQDWRARRHRVEPQLTVSPSLRDDDVLILDRPLAMHDPPSAAEAREPLISPRLKERPVPRRPKQPTLPLEDGAGTYRLPSLDLLSPPRPSVVARMDDDALSQNARLLESVLQDFGVKGTIVRVRPGPVVTLYELEPAPGIKSSRVIGLADDIARSMSAVSVRVAVVPGRNVIGIELPNQHRETVYLRELLASESYERAGAKLALSLGKDIGGAPVVVDLARMPHLLIAGTTGSGKSVAINTMILSLLYRLAPDRCRFIMVDPKMLELSVYDGIPHLLSPVVTDPKKAIVALKWTVREMENRYRAMSKLGVRNIEGYNARLEEARSKGETLTRRVQTGFDADSGKPVFEDEPLDLKSLPYIVVVVDEMADLMLVAGKDIEWAIQRLAQMARAAGIHLMMATQRPSVDVITGTIKANFPTRVSFQVTSKIDSRTILGEQGAEQLLGQGDMLYMAGGGRIVRVHGPFVADSEVEDVVRFLKSQGQPEYVDEVTEDEDEAALLGPGGEGEGSGDEFYDQAMALVLRERKCSTSFIQRHLQIGYNRAARIVEKMEAEGVVGPANHVGKREVLGRPSEDAA
jgi:S-DNA-T family DNA segregation ATPase FtsK/SpoIIIE